MKVRFYRGPVDGKIKDLAPGQHSIKVSIPNTKPDWVNVPVSVYLDDIISPSHKMYNEYIYRRTAHTHPDGSVFYEWDQPKGTKF